MKNEKMKNEIRKRKEKTKGKQNEKKQTYHSSLGVSGSIPKRQTKQNKTK